MLPLESPINAAKGNICADQNGGITKIVSAIAAD